MKQILLVGTNQLAKDMIVFTHDNQNMKLFALCSESDLAFKTMTKTYHIQTFSNVEECKHIPFDFICFTEENAIIKRQLQNGLENENILSVETMELLHTVIQSKFQFSLNQMNELKNVKTMLNGIRDGVIVIDEQENIQFMNQAAAQIIGCDLQQSLHHKITSILPESRLPFIIQTQQKEIDMLFKINEEKSIVTTRVPLFDENNMLVGAFAIFKAHEDVIKLAEENTNLKELQTMLEAIIHASGEAISVVDEHGKGLMFNHAYTKLTGLQSDDVIGKHATIDITEGESIHLQVIKKRRAIHGVPLKVGMHHTDVIVNASPIIVSGKMRGSIAVIHDVSHIKKLSSELKQAKQMIRNLESTFTFGDIIGNSPHIRLAIEQAKIAATSSMAVLLKGEHGVGKELFAHAIHNESERKYNKFIRVSCTNVSEAIMESELFGYEETNIANKKSVYEKGVFEEANYGTVLLDEISALAIPIQKQLASVIENQEMVRIGGTDTIPVDLQIIVSTSVSLEEKVLEGSFDKSLYDAIHSFPISIPPLRNRMEDLYELIQMIISEKNELYGRNVKHISTDALYDLKAYHWPGNVRELENVIDRAIIFMKQTESTIHKEHMPVLQEVKQQDNVMKEEKESGTLQEAVDAFEEKYIANVYKRNKFNKAKTAKELRISLRNLYYKIEKYQLDQLEHKE